MTSKTMRQAPAGRVPGEYAPNLGPDRVSLNELYFTLQGECRFAGTPTVFVRASHCPLRCTWCDSKYTFYEGRPEDVDAIVERATAFSARHACLTGGEPIAQPGMRTLARRLAEQGWTVEIETSGSEDLAPTATLPPPLRQRITINLDVKCPQSAMANFNRWDNFAHLQPHDQLKFIIGDRGDFDYAKDVLARHGAPCTVWFIPVWKALEPSVLAQWIKDETPQVRLGLQTHKYIWGDVRGV